MLEVQNLSYSTKTFSMENVSFSLDDGYLMTLLGRNGAGKTTLFDLVYGRIEPLSGKVLWNDIDVTGMKAIDILYHDEVAYVGGRSWCIGGIRADENIRLLSCLYSRWDQKHFDEMLEMMEFTKEGHKKMCRHNLTTFYFLRTIQFHIPNCRQLCKNKFSVYIVFCKQSCSKSLSNIDSGKFISTK